MSKLNIIGAGYEGRSKNINASRCINFFPEIETSDSKTVVALIGTIGSAYWASASTKIRGMHVFNNLIYYVAGKDLYSIDINRNILGPLGETLSTNEGRVVFSDNGLSPTGGDQIIFSDGVKIYCYDITENFTTILDITASVNCFIGGYIVADYGSGGRFRWSNLNDGSVWDALDFATAESSPDELISIFNNHGELWLFGEYTTEIWYQSGDSASPFQRASGGIIDYGCAARYSVAQCQNTIFWLGNVRNNNHPSLMGVYKANGYSAELVSTVPINYRFSQYNVVNDAFAFTYSFQGHEFYVLTFPSENITLVYDTTTNLWHEWSTYSGDPYKTNRHLSNFYCRFYGRHFVSDYRNNTILEMSDNFFTDNGFPIVSTRITENIFDENNLENLFISKLQLDLETGVEISNSNENVVFGIGNDITMKYINGNGKTPLKGYFDGTYLWTADLGGSVTKIRIIDRTVVATIGEIFNPFSDPNDITSDGENIWVSDVGSGGPYHSSIWKINPNTNTVIDEINRGNNQCRGIIYTFSSIWFCEVATNNVIRINPSDKSILATIASGSEPFSIASDGNFIFAANKNDGTISKIDPNTNTVVSTITVGGIPCDLFFDGIFLWVADRTGYIKKINTVNNLIISTISGFSSVYGVTGNGKYIFVSDDFGYKIFVIDTSTETIIYSIDVQDIDSPTYVYPENENIWISFGSQISRISENNKVYFSSALISWSDDGGYTWSNEHFADMGSVGEYKKRIIWRRLGHSKNRVFRFSISDPIKKVINAQYIEVVK